MASKAANTEAKAERSTAAIMTVDDTARWTTSNPLIVSPPENLGNTCAILYTLFGESRDPIHLDNIMALLEKANPDLVFGPHTAAHGVASFFAFDDQPFTLEDALALVRELKIAAPTMPDLSANVVQAAHRILMGDDELRDRLPYADLGLFLVTCNDTFPPASSMENEDDHLLVHAVKAALTAVERAAIWKTGSNVAVEPLSERNFRLMISAAKGILDNLIVFDKDYRQQVARQHGGVAKHASMDDLMNKTANAIDVEAQKFNFEQIANIHAVQVASGSSQIAEKLSELSGLFGKALNVGK